MKNKSNMQTGRSGFVSDIAFSDRYLCCSERESLDRSLRASVPVTTRRQGDAEFLFKTLSTLSTPS